MKRFFFTLCILLHCFSLQGSGYKEIENQAKTPLLTPSLKDRKTLKIRLDNGLSAILVSDPQAEKSSAALVVKAGSWQDPEDFPGIAHFLEHMLFLGTKKYPQESGYQNFIKEHGGQTNAFTASEFTAYLFSVNNNAFDEALDRFAYFFKEPLFNASGVSRELQAIDQEYAKNIEVDDIRFIYVMKELQTKEHPNFGFGMGNSQALSKVSRDELIRWYKDHYSANLMNLIIYSPLDLETLKNMVLENFGDIQNNAKQAPQVPNVPFFSEDTEGKIVYIEPIKNTRSLILTWALPEKFSHMEDSKPEAIVCYVLGHEGKESLLANLKQEQLAESLKCGGERVGTGTTLFYIDVGLTERGVKNVDDVVEKVFQAIANYKEKGALKRIFDEVQQTTKIQYEFLPREDAFEAVMKDAIRLSHEKIETFPEQSYIIQKFDPKAVQEMLSSLTAKNSRIFLQVPSILTGIVPDKQEKWLGVKYAIRSIPQNTIDRWSKAKSVPQIDLPGPNPFIPRNLDILNPIVASKNDKLFRFPNVALIHNDAYGKIYFAPDTYFGLPEIFWYVEIKTPQIKLGASKKIILGDLYVKALEEKLNNFSYDALQAGLNFQIKRTDNGVGILIHGYNENASLLLDEILRSLKKVNITEEQFNIYKDTLLREYENFAKSTPLEQAIEVFRSSVYKNFTTEKQKTVLMQKATFDNYKAYLAQLFKNTFVEAILYGNMTQDEAVKLADHIIDSIGSNPYPEDKQFKQEVILLPPNLGPFYIEQTIPVLGNAVILAIEDTTFSFKERAAQQILMQGLSNPFFATLRTKQQTGYIVDSTSEDLERKLFNAFIIQSNTHGVRDLLARIELFVESYVQEMGQTVFDEVNFNTIRDALVENLQSSFNNISTTGDLIKTLAFKHNGQFDWMEKRIGGFKDLTYKEFLKISKEVLGKENKRRLGILMSGSIPENTSLNYKSLNNLNQLRNYSTYSPATGG